jgi:protein-disulfide isomerase
MFHEESARNGEHLVLTPKVSFVLGLVGGVLVICSVGFFILLGVVLKGDDAESLADSAVKAAAAAEDPSAADPTAAVPEEDVVGEVALVDESDYVKGNAKAKVTLITYSDFECPYCGNFHDTMNQVMDDYDGEIKWVYRNFPLSFHANANSAALAAQCAGEQGKFWEYADKLFANQSSFSSENFSQWAKDLKLSASKFDSCMSSKKYQSKIDDDKASGSVAGVSGTPATIIMNESGYKELIAGAYPLETVEAKIDEALE